MLCVCVAGDNDEIELIAACKAYGHYLPLKAGELGLCAV